MFIYKLVVIANWTSLFIVLFHAFGVLFIYVVNLVALKTASHLA